MTIRPVSLPVLIMDVLPRLIPDDPIYCQLYEGLHCLCTDLAIRERGGTSCRPGHLDLHLDILARFGQTATVALSHYPVGPTDELIPSPDVLIRVDFAQGLAEVLSYQDAGRYDEIYVRDSDGELTARAGLAQSLNSELLQWLDDLLGCEYHFPREQLGRSDPA